jgi:hypothetical protein
MNKMSKKLPVAIGAVAGAATAVTLSLAMRPWFLNWGATEEEITRFWPGDEMSPAAASVATRAITIKAPAQAIWPWLSQIGQERGGFYSYSWLENLFGAKIHNAKHLLPGLPERQVGDTVRMTPKERYGGMGCMRVARLEPGRDMVLVSPGDYENALTHGVAPEGTWAFLLETIDERTTRLIVRSRSGAKPGALRYLVFDPIHFVMERKMMLGLRDRAQAAARPLRAVRAA